MESLEKRIASLEAKYKSLEDTLKVTIDHVEILKQIVNDLKKKD